jgi:protocatechuate 3,4-dioxygenase beta subunit
MKSDLKSISRRKLLSNGVALGGSVAALLASGKALAEMCLFTTPQGEGPYYPEHGIDRDADLVQLVPGAPPATGQVIFIDGKVTDGDCRPIPGALVEIWQACATGKYNHSGDTHAAVLDPNFQYWGKTRSNADGTYRFRSILPGRYPNGGNTYRPAHVHFKVHAAGFYSLTTQMYFDPRSYDDPAEARANEEWNIYENVPQTLKIVFNPSRGGSKAGTFDIALQKN